MKILHTADIHLGRKFNSYPEIGKELHDARYQTLEKLVDRANDDKYDAIVIAGDLFERTSMNKGDVVRAVQMLNKFARGPVLVLPGNHDFITTESDLWRYVNDSKEEHVIVLGEKKPVNLTDYDLPAVVYPAPCHSKHSDKNEIGWIKESVSEKNSDLTYIGIAHGSLEGVAPNMSDKHFPITSDELDETDLDLWLLGHIHLPWPKNPGKKDNKLYAGTPEPDDINCTHGGTAIMIDVSEDGEIGKEILSTGKYRFKRWNKKISSVEDLDDLNKEAAENKLQDVVCRLTVSGKLEEEALNKWNSKIMPNLREVFLHLKVDDSNLKRKVTREQVEREFPEESFPEQLLLGLLEDNEEEALQTAYEVIEGIRDEA